MYLIMLSVLCVGGMLSYVVGEWGERVTWISEESLVGEKSFVIKVSRNW